MKNLTTLMSRFYSTDLPVTTDLVPSEDKCAFRMLMLAIPILLAVTFVMNLVAISTLLRIPKGSDVINHMLITMLAVNDLLVAALYILSWFGSYAVCGKLGGQLGCNIIGWVTTACFIWSTFIVSILTGIRYLSVSRPYLMRSRHFNTRRVAALTFGTLAYTLLMTSYPFITGPPFHFYENSRFCALDFSPGRGGRAHRGMLGCVALHGIILVVFTLVCNIHTVIIILRQGRRLRPRGVDVAEAARVPEQRSSIAELPPTQPSGEMSSVIATVSHRSLRRQTRASFGLKLPWALSGVINSRFSRVMVAISAAFVVCYAPFSVRILYDVVVNTDHMDSISHRVNMGFLFLNSSINPIIYVIFNANYRRKLAGCGSRQTAPGTVTATATCTRS